MTEQKKVQKESFSLDWLVQGVLTKLGDTFDRLTGRGWNPSSSLATSKLIEKLKALLDAEIRDLGVEGKFAPHSIKLMIQWDKFSTDSDDDLKKLESELHAAAIDHINDRLYHTYAPIDIEIKTDYFTEGVRLIGGFGKFSDGEEDDESSVVVTLPNLNRDQLLKDGKISVNLNEEELRRNLGTFLAKFDENGTSREIILDFTGKKRKSIGRSKENDLTINDRSISKIHASLVLNSKNELVIADTGSTNGTYVSGERISYGKAFEITLNQPLKLGGVNVVITRYNSLETEPEDEKKSIDSSVHQSLESSKESENISPQAEETEVWVDKSNLPGEGDLDDTVKGDDSEADLEISVEKSASNLDKTQDWEV